LSFPRSSCPPYASYDAKLEVSGAAPAAQPVQLVSQQVRLEAELDYFELRFEGLGLVAAKSVPVLSAVLAVGLGLIAEAGLESEVGTAPQMAAGSEFERKGLIPAKVEMVEPEWHTKAEERLGRCWRAISFRVPRVNYVRAVASSSDGERVSAKGKRKRNVVPFPSSDSKSTDP
jgi:hypothetical protein